MNVSVVVPVYNSEATIAPLVDRLRRVLAEAAEDYEIILVNDGSTDRSWDTIRTLAADGDKVVGVDLMRNYGQHNALLQGINIARHEAIVTIDDDLQNPPEEIPRLLRELEAGADVVYGIPAEIRQSFWRRRGSALLRLMVQSALGPELARSVSSFRAMRSELKQAFREYRGPFIIIDVPLSWGTSRFGAVRVRHEPRREGTSNYGFIKLLAQAVNVITGFSAWPLKVVSFLGFGFTVFGVGILVYVVGRYLVLGYSFPGFPFLASIIAIFSGAQFLVLGIIGSYLARLHFRNMGRPAGLVRETTRGGQRA
ncbi:MAG TPA: glycosyltransferase family 2 protein [bacterium]|nr:glycosyltransferase family 2 protein [bacterium]HPJ71986.1 glycosyltransferase family 2 protein [bacterium]HPQ66556.1 glycosyltransferase family 2 protein [bacterium]